jgi:hypothetical protein
MGLGGFGFAQEADAPSGSSDLQKLLILPVEGKPGKYQKGDGTILATEDAFSQFSLCPQNKGVLEKIRTGTVVSAIGFGTAAALSTLSLSFEIAGIADQKTKVTMLSASIVDLLLSIFVSRQTDGYRNRAMVNYNFFVMGSPVSTF